MHAAATGHELGLAFSPTVQVDGSRVAEDTIGRDDEAHRATGTSSGLRTGSTSTQSAAEEQHGSEHTREQLRAEVEPIEAEPGLLSPVETIEKTIKAIWQQHEHEVLHAAAI